MLAEEAGPSGAGAGKATAEDLAAADAKFERGIQCIRTNDLDTAVKLFAEVLKVRAEHYGELAPECAPAYFRYGSTLLYQAQDSGDVFGGGVQEEEEEEAPEPPAAGNKENGGKGKAPAEPAGHDAQEEEEEGEESSEGGTDLQLAWENLETAKVIWQRQAAEAKAAGDDKAFAQQLADVHGLLGDVAMESDDFVTALAELDAALAYLQSFVEEDDRRIAEVQYKRCCALQFAEDVEGALVAVQAAVACLAKRRESLLRKLAAPGEGEEADKEREQLQSESEDVAAVQEDLKEKVAELEELIAQNADTKSMIRGAMAQLAAVAGGGGGAQQAQQQPAAAPAPAEETIGFGAPGAAPAGGAAPALVKNLGVVGRGTKRINLQPVQTNVPAPAPGAAGAEPATKKKRSLEDLMGGGDTGETTIGFGAAPAPAAATENKEAAAAPAAAPPAVPAFLQATSVADVYGGTTPEQHK
ncbi:TPR domain containing [Micractinium conductrix]|uniref:TPR domain containing n=1 Tax=Micractinium conductrix TaxID=554055 RepID=A0A2P6VJ67_9CHLO|nr:TPR domain containing [Micractinium conductrix]|eukprot:PSC74146.1 TPR domain containing [Micractinium conductrix]